MHELKVTENILAIALRHAAQADASQITELSLVVGELASIVDESVQFYWDFISQETIASGATLHFRHVPAQMQCQLCCQVYSPGTWLTCPTCGGSNISIIDGEQFFLEAIEVASSEAGVVA